MHWRGVLLGNLQQYRTCRHARVCAHTQSHSHTVTQSHTHTHALTGLRRCPCGRVHPWWCVGFRRDVALRMAGHKAGPDGGGGGGQHIHTIPRNACSAGGWTGANVLACDILFLFTCSLGHPLVCLFGWLVVYLDLCIVRACATRQTTYTRGILRSLESLSYADGA